MLLACAHSLKTCIHAECNLALVLHASLHALLCLFQEKLSALLAAKDHAQGTAGANTSTALQQRLQKLQTALAAGELDCRALQVCKSTLGFSGDPSGG